MLNNTTTGAADALPEQIEDAIAQLVRASTGISGHARVFAEGVLRQEILAALASPAQPAPSMSMYASRADYDAAVAAQPAPATPTDEEIIEIRKATRTSAADLLRPWSDTLAFARALLSRYGAQPAPTDALPNECAATGRGCEFGPHGPRGASQCGHCGEPPEVSAPTAAQGVPSSLSEDEADPIKLWAEIARLREAVKGPAGYATWQDAATDERIRRVRAERSAQALASQQAQAAPVAWLVTTRRGFQRPALLTPPTPEQIEDARLCGDTITPLGPIASQPPAGAERASVGAVLEGWSIKILPGRGDPPVIDIVAPDGGRSIVMPYPHHKAAGGMLYKLAEALLAAPLPPADPKPAPSAPWVKESIDGAPVFFSDADVAAHQEAMRRDLGRPPAGQPTGPSDEEIVALVAELVPDATPGDALSYLAVTRALLARHGQPADTLPHSADFYDPRAQAAYSALCAAAEHDDNKLDRATDPAAQGGERP